MDVRCSMSVVISAQAEVISELSQKLEDTTEQLDEANCDLANEGVAKARNRADHEEEFRVLRSALGSAMDERNIVQTVKAWRSRVDAERACRARILYALAGEMPCAVDEFARALIAGHKPMEAKIPAIRDLRHATGLGLKEAKAMIDEHWDDVDTSEGGDAS